MTTVRKLGLIAGCIVLVALVVFGVLRYEAQQKQRKAEALIQVEIALGQFGRQEFAAAVETLRGIPEGATDDWRAPYYEGAALINLKEYQQAAVALEKAWQLNDQQEGIAFAMGVAYFKLGNLALSKRYFHAVLELNPENEDARGLMDIMAKLERNQPQSNTDNAGGAPIEDDTRTGDFAEDGSASDAVE